jgi:hypothetical protein
MFSWVKAHTGNYGNELADRLAKDAARNDGTNHTYSRIPKSTLHYETSEETKQRWQDEWTTCNKAAATKQYFPNVRDRLGTRLNLTPKLAAVLSGHGETRAYWHTGIPAYLHRFKIREDATCICGQGEQTTDRLLFDCVMTLPQREVLQQNITKIGKWPASKQ